MAAPKKTTKKPVKKTPVKATAQAPAEKATPLPSLSLRRLNRRQALLIGVLAALLIGFLARGWFRVSVGSAVITSTHGKDVQKVMQDEMEQLGQPLTMLGYDTVDQAINKCNLHFARKLSTTYYCSYGQLSSRELSTEQVDKDAMNQAASDLQAALQANGWDGEFTETAETTSLTLLVKNLNNNIDYTPDATYLKSIGDVTCIFTSSTAYSSPNPAAIGSQFLCTREVGVFGSVSPDVLYGPDHIDAVMPE